MLDKTEECKFNWVTMSYPGLGLTCTDKSLCSGPGLFVLIATGQGVEKKGLKVFYKYGVIN